MLATEEPRGERREVLLMQGKVGRERIPLVLSDDSTVANIVGSVLVRTQADRLVGVVGFASDSRAELLEISSWTAAPQYRLDHHSRHRSGAAYWRAVLQCGRSRRSANQWEPLQVVLSPVESTIQEIIPKGILNHDHSKPQK
ncbi:MAG: hypothetical protein R3C56_35635 [Pirellulaceae bacterium]